MSGRRTDDDERVGKHERADVGHDGIFSHAAGWTLFRGAAARPADYRVPAACRRKISTSAGASGVLPRIRSAAFSATIITGA